MKVRSASSPRQAGELARSAALPEGWSVVSAGRAEPYSVSTFGMHPMAYMYDIDGDYAGVIAWEELKRLGMSNRYLWEDLGQTVSGGTNVYTMKITYDEYDESLLPEHPWKSFDTLGIRAEDEGFGVYVAVQFAPGAVSEAQAEDMARSVSIGAAEDKYVSGFAGSAPGVTRDDIKEVFADVLLEGEPLRRGYEFNLAFSLLCVIIMLLKKALNKSPCTSRRHIFRLFSPQNLEIHKVFLQFWAFNRQNICSPS